MFRALLPLIIARIPKSTGQSTGEALLFQDPVFVSALHAARVPFAKNGSCGGFGVPGDITSLANAARESIEGDNPQCAISLTWSFYQSVPWWDEASVQRNAFNAGIAGFNAGNTFIKGVDDLVPYGLPYRDRVYQLLLVRKAYKRAVRAASNMSPSISQQRPQLDTQLLDASLDSLTFINGQIRNIEAAIFEPEKSDDRDYIHHLIASGELSDEMLSTLGDDSYLRLSSGCKGLLLSYCDSGAEDSEDSIVPSLRDSLLRVRYGDVARAVRHATPRCFSSVNDNQSEKLEVCAVLALAAMKASDVALGRDMVPAALRLSSLLGTGESSVSRPPKLVTEGASLTLHYLGVAKQAALELERFRDYRHHDGSAVVEQVVNAVQDRIDRIGSLQLDLPSVPNQGPRKTAHRSSEENRPSKLIGLFVLRGPDRAFVSESPGPALALSARSLWFERPDLRLSLKVHVLVDFLPISASVEEVRWKSAFGSEAAPLFAGLHVVQSAPLALRPEQGNYLRKIYFMWATASDRAYSHILSVDDDVLIAPAALASLIFHAPEGVLEHGKGADKVTCAVTTPTVSSGIPTVELFMDDFLNRTAKDAMFRCFADVVSRGPAPLTWGDKECAAVKAGDWPREAWYRDVEARANGILMPPIRSEGAGYHPIRQGDGAHKCQRMMANISFDLLFDHFGPVKQTAHRPRAHVHTSQGPYLANSVWITRTESMANVLAQEDALFQWTHPFDEAALNVLMRRAKSPLCVVRNTFVIHPHYSHERDSERRLHDHAKHALDGRLKAPSDLAPEPPTSVLGKETSEHENCAASDVRDTALSRAVEIHLFIHAALITGWERVLGSIMFAIESGGLGEAATSIRVVACGDTAQINESFFLQWAVSATKVILHRSSRNRNTFEGPTLDELYKHARAVQALAANASVTGIDFVPKQQAILYVHTENLKEDWRNFMTYFVIERFCMCLERIVGRGVGRQAPLAATCGVDLREAPAPHYAGNFWWARADYLARVGKSPQSMVDIIDFPNILNSWRHNQQFWLLSGPVASRASSNLWRWDTDSAVRWSSAYPPWERSMYANDDPSCTCRQATETALGLAGGDDLTFVIQAPDGAAVTGEMRPAAAGGSRTEEYLAHFIAGFLTSNPQVACCGCASGDFGCLFVNMWGGLHDRLARTRSRHPRGWDIKYVTAEVVQGSSKTIALYRHHDQFQQLCGIAIPSAYASAAPYFWEREPSDSPQAARAGIMEAARRVCSLASVTPDGDQNLCFDTIVRLHLDPLSQVCRFRLGARCLAAVLEVDPAGDAAAWVQGVDGEWHPYTDATSVAAVYPNVTESYPYRSKDGACVHQTERSPPADHAFARALPSLFPDAMRVFDVGGGPGVYLTGFRASGLADLTVFEPSQQLAGCTFAGVAHDTRRYFAPGDAQADVVLSIEVAEHVAFRHHGAFFDALAARTRRWLVFSAAPPGQGGPQGPYESPHVACRTPAQWRTVIETRTTLVFDPRRTALAREAASAYLSLTLMVFRKLE